MKLFFEFKFKGVFKNWPGGINENKAGSCPKCGSEVICQYAEEGSADFVDVYSHVCTNPDCDYELYQEFFSVGMSSRSETGPNPCPFCNRAVD